MSQAGTPSQDTTAGTIPTITAANVRIAFVPDMDSLEQVYRDAERRGLETVARVKEAGKAAIAEILDDALAAMAKIEAARRAPAATATASDIQYESQGRVAPVADQQLLKLTEIGVKLDDIADTASEIAANTRPQ
jgi:hypothetical protein